MVYAVRLIGDLEPQFRYDPDLHIRGQKIPHAFLQEVLPEQAARVPTRGVEITRGREMVDFVLVSGKFCISEKFKALIEAREPGRHQFFEIALSRHNGKPVPGRYYLLNILTNLAAQDVADGHHIWLVLTKSVYFFVSDELARDIWNAGFTGIELSRIRRTHS